MSKDDYEQKDVRGEYIPKGEVPATQERDLSPIPLPPDNVMRSAFLTAIKYRSVQTALSAYNNCINELTRTKNAQAGFHRAQVEEERAIELLKDSSTVHATDTAKRKMEQLRAEEALAQMEHEAALAGKLREMEKRNADIQHQNFMQGQDNTDNLSQEDKELKEYMESRILRSRREKAIADLIRKEGNLSEEEEKILDELLGELSTT